MLPNPVRQLFIITFRNVTSVRFIFERYNVLNSTTHHFRTDTTIGFRIQKVSTDVIDINVSREDN